MKVRRRTPPPWNHPERTRLSDDPHYNDGCQFVYITRGMKRFNVGTIDHGQRLYQHAAKDGLKHLLYNHDHTTWVAYDLHREWPVIHTQADWIEVVDEQQRCCYRIAVRRARKTGRKHQTQNGPRFLVPLAEYERSRW